MKVLQVAFLLAVAFAMVNAKALDEGNKEEHPPKGESSESNESDSSESGSAEVPTDPDTPPKEGDSCHPHLCKNTGSCQSFLRCDRETETWVAEQCGEEMFWNPDNGTVHGGNCDYHDNISEDVMDGYRADPDCLGCFWKANGECEAGYKYQAPGNRNRNVLDMSCSEGLVFSQEKETCQKCSDVTKADGSACC